MDAYEVTAVVSIEASNYEDAEELLIELLESDPAVTSWHLEDAEVNRTKTFVQH